MNMEDRSAQEWERTDSERVGDRRRSVGRKSLRRREEKEREVGRDCITRGVFIRKLR